MELLLVFMLISLNPRRSPVAGYCRVSVSPGRKQAQREVICSVGRSEGGGSGEGLDWLDINRWHESFTWGVGKGQRHLWAGLG